MGFSPKVAADLMPVFADTLIGEDGALSDYELPGLIAEAINGKKAALDKLQLGVKDLKKFRASTLADRKTQVVQVLDKRYKGANAKSKAQSEA